MPADTSMLHVRIDKTLKAKATDALDAIGLSTSDAVRLLFHRIVADQAFPLEFVTRVRCFTRRREGAKRCHPQPCTG